MASLGQSFISNCTILSKKVEKARTNYENLSLSSACEAVLEIGNAGNTYMDQRAPWFLFKQGGVSAEAAAKVLFAFPNCTIYLIQNKGFITNLMVREYQVSDGFLPIITGSGDYTRSYENYSSCTIPRCTLLKPEDIFTAWLFT